MSHAARRLSYCDLVSHNFPSRDSLPTELHSLRYLSSSGADASPSQNSEPIRIFHDDLSLSAPGWKKFGVRRPAVIAWRASLVKGWCSKSETGGSKIDPPALNLSRL